MDVLSPKERLLRSLKGEAVDRAPVICPGGMMNSAIVDVMKNHGNVLPDGHRDSKMVSSAVYTTLCGDIIREALQRITTAVPEVTVHVCSATSAAFQRAGFCQCRPFIVPKEMCYGEALCFACRRAGVHLVGHGCLQHSCCRMAKPVVYELKLC